MKSKYLIFALIIVAFFYVASCAPVQQGQTAPKSGIGASQPAKEPSVQPKQEISVEVKELMDKSKVKVNNIYYKYRGPETTSVGYNLIEFYVKGNKIKYKPIRELKALDKPDSYDVIYIDRILKTAQTYCDDRACIYKGKKGDLNYNEAYILTIFDWIGGIKSATKVGEEVIDDRSTWKIETNEGFLWIDTFYGIPLKIESGGKTFKFEQIAVNSVQDSDVSPS